MKLLECPLYITNVIGDQNWKKLDLEEGKGTFVMKLSDLYYRK